MKKASSEEGHLFAVNINLKVKKILSKNGS